MPKIVEVPGVGNVEFPDSMSDDQIAAQLRKQPAPAQPQTAAEKFGVTNPVGKAALDALEGVGAGVMSTIYHGGDLIRRATGQERIINSPEVQAQMQTPDSLAGKAGKFAEQAAEFAIPGAAAAKATKGAGLVARMGAEALAAGGTAAVQSGGDTKAMVGGGLAGAAGPVVGAAAQGVAKAVAGSRAPSKLYQSALKPNWNQVKKEGLTMLDTGIKEQIPVSAEGLKMVEQRISDIQGEISKGIERHAAQGRTVDSANVLKALEGLKDFYRNTAAPEKALKVLDDLEFQFGQYHGQKIPLDVAQKIKINTYQELKAAYGEMATAKVEGLKQIARGLKDEISAVFPEIAQLNERQAKLIGLDEALTRAVWRIENHQLMGIGSGIAAGAGGAVAGGPGAAGAFMAKLLADNPTIKSKLAIALSKAGTKQSPMRIVSERLAALKNAANKSASTLAGDREAPTGQLVPVGAR